MANDWGKDDPVADAPSESWGAGDVVVSDNPSPFSQEAIAKDVQELVALRARRMQLRDEDEARLAAPRIGVGLRDPYFTGKEIVRVDLPEEVAAFASEAVKSSPSTAAGIAAASASMPLASRVGAIPGPVGAVGRFGIPLVSGAAAAIGTRFAQDEVLPQILPEDLEEAYRVSSEIAARNPTSALLGQVAGAAPFFRPGLPIGAEGSARLTVPLISGGIGGGIEGAQQITEGELDVPRLAAATLASGLMNRETRLGARIGPNLVLPNMAGGTPSELDVVGRTLREPVEPMGIPPTNQILPDELATMGRARAEAEASAGARGVQGERAVADMDSRIDSEKVRALAERMAGKPVQDQLSILEQELKLQKDFLNDAEIRAGLDLKIELKRQIEAQKALEDAARQEQQAAKAAEKAAADAQKAAQEAMTPPEAPKSQQILEESGKPKALANIATDVATQTKQSPYALQASVNQMTQIEAPAPSMPQVAPAEFVGVQEGIPGKIADMELYNLTQDIPGHNTGSTVTRKTLEEAGFTVPPRAKGEPTDALQIESPASLLQRQPRQAGKAGRERQRMEREQSRPASAGDEVREAAVPETRSLKPRSPDGSIDDMMLSTAAAMNSLPKNNIQYRSAKIAMDIAAASKSPADEQAALRVLAESAGSLAREVRKSSPKNANLADALEASRDKAIDTLRRSAELRLNNAGLDLPPISSLSASQKLAELKAAGVTTYKGKPIEDANPAQLSAALGQHRRGQLGSERGAVNPAVLSGGAGSFLGGSAGFLSTSREPGETDEEFQARRLSRTAAGAAIGAGAGALGAMARGAKRRIESGPAPKKPGERQRVSKPSPEGDQGVRQLAEKVIDDTKRSTQLRQALAENPEIIYDKFLLSDLAARVEGASVEELNTLRASQDRNEKAAATIELANRAAAAGNDAEAAALYADASTQFTSSAQLLNVAKLVRSPVGYVTAVKKELAELGRTTTPKQDAEIARLGKDVIKAEQALAGAQRAAEADFSVPNQKAFEAARDAAAKANKALAQYVGEIVPKGFDDILIQTIQGNLLTPLSQIANVYGNVLFQPVRRGSMAIASALDAVFSASTGAKRTIDRTNPLPRAREFEAFADGVRVASRELLSGPGSESFVKGEVQRGFRPIRSLVQAVTGENLPVSADGKVANYDRFKKFVEGTIGAPPEVMFRLLNLGDRGFRRAAEIETLLEQARLRGLKGRDLERFIEFPDKLTQALLNTEARKAIFAQENAGVNQLNAFLDSGLAKLLHLDQIPAAKGAIKIFGRLNVPFRQFPVNYVMTALNFAVPELALTKGAYYSLKGDRRKALTNIGEGIMGATMYAAAAYLWENGLISEPMDKDAKRRSIQYDNMGGQRINLSGLQRALDGGDPTWRRDDVTVDWGRMGIPAPVFYVYTQSQNKDRKELQQTGVRPPPDTSAVGQLADRVKSYPGIGQFALDQSFLAGSSAFLEALKNGFTGPEADAWAANMFRAASTIAVPNSVEALARAEYQYVPELRGDTLPETFKNIWDYKTFQLPADDRALLKRDIWGEPISRTPPNQNPYVFQFLDVTKAQEKQDDPFKAGLVKIFNESDNPNTYPSMPDRAMTVEGVTAKLDPKDYETLQALTGRLRREQAEPLVLDPEFSTIPAGERVAELERIYSSAASEARKMLLSDEAFRMKYFGEVYGGSPSERVTRRDTKARNRLEQGEDTPFWEGDEPTGP